MRFMINNDSFANRSIGKRNESEAEMKILSLEQELKNNDYPGRGIVIGRSELRHILLWEGVQTAGTGCL